MHIKFAKVLSLIQQTQQGSSCTLDRAAGNMVLQSFDLGLNCGDNLPPYAGDYAPSSGFYSDLDTALYSQGKLDWFFFIKQILDHRVIIFVDEAIDHFFLYSYQIEIRF